MSRKLDMDLDGRILLIDEREDDDDAVTFLGMVNEVATSYKVPPDLLDELEWFKADWDEMTAYSRDCRDEAEFSYRSNL